MYNVVLDYAVQQNESALGTHISPLFWISLSFRSAQSNEQSFLCYTVGSHLLSVLYTVSVVLEEGMATHSNMLAWRVPWAEEPGEVQSIESQRVRHD